jgi:hypothetical protein
LDVLYAAFAHFLLLLADEAYVAGQHQKVKSILSKMDISQLDDEEASFAEKIKLRSYLPTSWVRIARKMKS